MSDTKIKTDVKTISEIFEEFWFVIPEYQRSYVWGTDNIKDLLDDLWYAYKKNPDDEYFLGSIVLKKLEESDKCDEYEVLDGQQRLTTFFLLMAVIRDISEDTDLKEICQKRTHQKATRFKGNIPERVRIVYKIRDKVGDFIQDYVLKNDGTLSPKIEEAIKNNNTSISHMANAIKEMKSFFSDKNIEDFCEFLDSKLVFIYISTKSREDAFRIFTILNNRGIPLTSADILKSINIGEVPNEEKNKYAEKWEEIEGHLGKDFNRFLSLIRTILVKEKANLNLLEEFEKNIYDKELLRKGKDTIDLIESYTDIYNKTILEPKLTSYEYNNLIAIMNIGLPSSDWIPPVLFFAKKFGYDKLPDFLKKLEFKFTSDWLSQYSSTERIKNMNEILKEIEKEGQTVDGLLNNDELFKINEENLENALNRNDFYRKKYARYILLKYEFLKSSNTALISNYKNISIEHILPQNPNENSQWRNDFIKDEIEDLKHNLGNLILINGKKNASLGNLDFTEKKEKYFKERIDIFPSGKIFLQQSEWKPQSIKNRQEEVIKVLLKNKI